MSGVTEAKLVKDLLYLCAAGQSFAGIAHASKEEELFGRHTNFLLRDAVDRLVFPGKPFREFAYGIINVSRELRPILGQIQRSFHM